MAAVDDNVPSLRARRDLSTIRSQHRHNAARDSALWPPSRTVLEDRQWSARKGIIFPDTAVPARAYAIRYSAKKPPPPPPPSEPTPRQGGGGFGNNQRKPADNCNRSPAQPTKPSSSVLQDVGKYQQELSDEKAAHKATSLALEQTKNALEAEQAARLEDQKRMEVQHQAHQQEMEEQARVNQAGQEAKAREQQRAFDARFKTLDDEAYQRARSTFHSENAAMRADSEQCLQSAEALKDEWAARAKELARQQEQAQDDNRKRKYDNAEHLSRERKNLGKRAEQEIRESSDRAEGIMAARFAEERAQFKVPGLAREHERKDYEAYRSVWRKFDSDVGKLSDGLRFVEKYVYQKAILWRETMRSFDPEEIEPWLPQRYPALVRGLRSMLEAKIQTAQQSEDSVKAFRQQFDNLANEVRTSGHYSRVLTRHHRFEQDHLGIKSIALRSEMLNERPLHAQMERNQKELQEIEGQLASRITMSGRESLEQRRAILTKDRSALMSLLAHFFALKDAETLKVLSQSSPKIQELYLRAEPIRAAIYEADRAWNTYNRERPARDEKNRKDRASFLETRGAMKDRVRAFEALTRKRQLLEEELGEEMSESDQEALAKTVAEKLSKAESTAENRLRELAKERTARRAPSTPSRSPVASSRPVKSAIELSGTPAEVSHIFRSKIAKLKRERASARSKAEKKRLEAQLKAINREYASWHHGRHELNKMKESEAQEKVNKATEDVNVNQSEASQASASDDVSVASVPSVTPREHAQSARPRLTRRAARRFRSRVRAKVAANAAAETQDASESQGSNRGGGSSRGLNFKPTAPTQAPLQSWPPFNADDDSEYPEEVFNMAIWNADVHARLQSDAFAGCSRNTAQESLKSEPAKSSFAKNTPMESESTISAFSHGDGEGSYFQQQQSSPASQSSASSYQPSEQPDSSVASQSAQNSQAENAAAAGVEGLPQLSHHMSTADYRNAVMASPNSAGAYWSHKLYKNSEGKPPPVYYCTNFETAELRAKEFANEPVIGFDIEWEMRHNPGKSGIKKNVSVIQIASDDKIALFHLAVFKGETIEELMPPSLRQILESRDVVKTGVNIQGDAWRLDECLDVKMSGLFELSHLYRVVMFSDSPDQINRKPFRLADQVRNVLLLPLKKDAVRTSAWSRKLDFQQSEYAAADAYAGFRLYHALEAKRMAMDPMPPRPAFWEEHKPIQLGDGTLIMAKTRKKVAAVEGKKSVEEDEDEDEEFFDAVESMDAYDLDAKSAGVPLAGLSIAYPTLPSTEEQLSDSLGKIRMNDSTESHTQPDKAPSKKSGPPPSSAIDQAEDWVSTYRSSAPPAHTIKATHAQLRAYALWHHQRLSCKEVAGLLREVPLQLQTVATYVLEAVRQEGLECEAERVRDVVGILPGSVRGRYGRVLERAEVGK